MRAAENWGPVLVLTAEDREYDQTDAFDLGADDYLTEPFSFPALVARLRALIRRGAPERPVVLAVGSPRVGPVLRSVTRRGQPVEPTPQECVLLQVLMQNQEKALSEAEIMDNAWDTAFEGSENIVEVYAGYLRKKIDAPFGLTALHTVRGMNYRLVPDDRGTTGP